VQVSVSFIYCILHLDKITELVCVLPVKSLVGHRIAAGCIDVGTLICESLFVNNCVCLANAIVG
jgi:hypothetical protein